jgi:SAM-dependent methyltransferase
MAAVRDNFNRPGVFTMSDTTNVATFAIDSAAYASARPTYPAALFDWLAAQSPARRSAWDVGCGNGQASCALAQRFERVIANDIAADQLAHAPNLANVTWQVAAAEQVALAPASIDLVLVAQALHWFDLGTFYPKVQRSLTPRGVFAAVGYSGFRIDGDIDREFGVTLLDPLQPFWARGNAVLWNGYRELPFPFEPIEAPPMAIELDWTLAQLLSYVETWSAVKRMRTETGVDPMAPTRERLAPMWGEGERRVTMPMIVRVGRKCD